MTRILLVDDQAMILHSIVDAIEDGGFSTLTAMSGKEAIEALNDPKFQFSGLVTDVNLEAGMTGWEVARAARRRTPEIPVVYMTGDSAHEWPTQGVPNSLVLQKPFAMAQLTTAIAQLITDAATRHALTVTPDSPPS
jgi:CheY-like chemotaxis protein